LIEKEPALNGNDDIAIKIEGLGKRYRLGETVDLQRTFRETLMTVPRHFGRKAARAGKRWAQKLQERARQAHYATEPGENEADAETPPGTFWALRDLDMEVKRGEAVGIIGRNGAGKSTLLKILSRITSPTKGYAELRGRVGSLLEIGTGFNPELTGRENIYLNGAILGMRKAEIVRKFDEIVAFADTEKFLDTPVKRYSSGMRVRLGFAVAAHLEPEILIVDEVLAVGDAEFQRKCLGKMQDVTGEGHSILFVSHNMQAIRSLCTKCFLLDKGGVEFAGTPDSVVNRYLSIKKAVNINRTIESSDHAVSPDGLRIEYIGLLDEDQKEQDALLVNKRYTLRLRYSILDHKCKFRAGIMIKTPDATVLSDIHTNDAAMMIEGEKGFSYLLDISWKNVLAPGNYYLDVRFRKTNGTWADIVDGIQFHVSEVVEGFSGILRPGLVFIDQKWSQPRVVTKDDE
jgi:lipopolysaccharide transport system ATP-binding protein